MIYKLTKRLFLSGLFNNHKIISGKMLKEIAGVPDEVDSL